MLLRRVEQKVKHGAGEQRDENNFSVCRFKQAGDDPADDGDANGSMQRHYPPVQGGEDNVKWTREHIRQHRSDHEENRRWAREPMPDGEIGRGRVSE